MEGNETVPLAPWDEGYVPTPEALAVEAKQKEAKEKMVEAKGLIIEPKSLSTLAKLKAFYGFDLNQDPNFSNSLDAKKLEDAEVFFQVSPYAFARRSMMRTSTVRRLLMERKIPRILGRDDQLMVIVKRQWLIGDNDPETLHTFGLNPEDFIDEI
jgi:hypothetical protein